MMAYREYFKKLLALTLLLAMLVVGLNLLVDPLDVFRIFKAKHINLYKPAYTPYARLGRPLQIQHIQPQRLALGSSRVLLGIPIEHDSWITGVGLNAGMNGATIRTVADLMEHAMEVSSPKDVLISTDLFMFNINQLNDYPNKLARYNESGQDAWLRQGSLLGEALFSPDITLASLETLRKQREKHNKYLPTGQGNPALEEQRSIHDGYENRFLQFEDSLARIAWSRCKDNQFPFSKNGHSSFDELDRILQLAAENHVRLRFFISPVHARVLETMSAASFWDEFEYMKTGLVAHVYDARARHPSLDAEVWDFSGYNNITIEALPTEPGQAMRWFYDSSHFTDAVGRMILDDIYSGASEKRLGTKLTPDNIVPHLEKLRLEQSRYRSDNGQQYQDIRARVDDILSDKRKNGDNCLAMMGRE